jgi:hypothetical protein
MTKAESALQFIETQIKEGRTICISTSLKCTKISPKTYANWQSKGLTLFKIDNEGNLRIARRKNFDIIVFKELSLVRIQAM